jgi:hypothetical protein
MRGSHRRLSGVLLPVVLAAAVGCGGSAPTRARSPGEYFKEQQAVTVTPYGKIVTDTVEEKDGRIEYRTEDGKRWRVAYSKRADGTYQYATPDEAK